MSQSLLDFLYSFVTENKRTKIEEVLLNRTNHFCVVLENVFQSQNISAVLRSCEVFGIQQAHIIENNNAFQVNPKVVMGASKWLDIHRYNKRSNNTAECIQKLKEQGYKIVSTSPVQGTQTIEKIDINTKTALLFGTELKGLSNEALSLSDDYVHIPMSGFTESLNISVSAAICIYEMTGRMKAEKIDWELTEEEKNALRISWCKKILKNYDLLEKKYLETAG